MSKSENCKRQLQALQRAHDNETRRLRAQIEALKATLELMGNRAQEAEQQLEELYLSQLDKE